jgi:REP element-mobilizing transposase RayT
VRINKIHIPSGNKINIMPGTFSQIYIQIVFAVQHRDCLIHSSWEEELYKYMSGIVRNKDQKMLAINGMPDHIHFLIGMKPSCCLSDLVREVKKSSNEFITEKRFSKFRFNWQEGYGAFSYGQSQIDSVIKYIINQKEHHKKQVFRDEYLDFLRKFRIEYKDEYLFNWIEE